MAAANGAQKYLYPACPSRPTKEGIPMLDGLNITLLKPNKRFPYTRYRLDVRARVGGTPRRRFETFSGTKLEAKERYFALLAELKGQEGLPIQAKTFGDLLERYRAIRGGLIPRSQRSVFDYLVRDLGSVELRALPDVLERYAGVLRAVPSARTGKRLSNGSVNRRRAMIAVVLNLSVELGIMEKSPLKKAFFPKLKEVPRDRYLSDIERQRLLNALEREAWHLLHMTRFALLVPCRKGELVKMRREDLDMMNSRIRVHNGTTKNDRGCWKPIPEEMRGYFRSLPPGCPWLFYRREKGEYRPLGDFKKAWRCALKHAGIEDFRFHDTRHIAMTGLVDAGTPERAVMNVAGCVTNMLSTYYHHGSEKALTLVKFPSGKSDSWVYPGYTSSEETEKSGHLETKKAVS